MSMLLYFEHAVGTGFYSRQSSTREAAAALDRRPAFCHAAAEGFRQPRSAQNAPKKKPMILKTFLLFVVTAIAEIVGCYLPYVWLRKGGSPWLLVPAALSLALFAWLLTMHPAASGRVYAAYGCVYVATALSWLKFVDGVSLSTTDMLGGAVALAGMLIIVSGWGSPA